MKLIILGLVLLIGGVFISAAGAVSYFEASAKIVEYAGNQFLTDLADTATRAKFNAMMMILGGGGAASIGLLVALTGTILNKLDEIAQRLPATTY